MARKFKVLQIGHSNDISEFEHLNDVSWDFYDANLLKQVDFNVESIHFFLNERKHYDLVLVQTNFSQELMSLLSYIISPFNTYIDEHYWNEAFASSSLINEQCARKLSYQNETELIALLQSVAFPGQYGDKIYPTDCIVNPKFNGKATYYGKSKVILEGDFGHAFTPVITWKSNLIYDKNKVIEIKPDFVIEGNAEVEYTFRVIELGSKDHIIDEIKVSHFENPILINKKSKDAHISVSIRAKGKGKLNIGAVHKRWSRLNLGEFILGGNKFTDDNKDEFIYYLNPGNLKPPLNVYFSGYRTAEGFEGFNMMKKLEQPFLLIADPRIEGGSFYIGTENYEQGIIEVIEGALNQLGFEQTDLILSGLSMGSFAALYYGVQLNPTAIIVGKPLVNIGTIAENMKLLRPNEFGTALDILLSQTGGYKSDNIKKMNDKFWHVMRESHFQDTNFAIAYMEDDDYDANAFDELLPFLNEKHAKVISRGIPGRHNDDSLTINNWFTNFYKIILESEFRGGTNG